MGDLSRLYLGFCLVSNTSYSLGDRGKEPVLVIEEGIRARFLLSPAFSFLFALIISGIFLRLIDGDLY